MQEPSGDFLLTIASMCQQKCVFLCRFNVRFAGAPKNPQLQLTGGTDGTQQYRVNDVLQAICKVEDARPVANISWYLGKT